MNNIFKVFSRVFVISILIKIFDIVKSLIIASKFGVSSSADIFMAIISIPDSMLILLGLDTIRGVINSEYSSFYSKGNLQEINSSYKSLFNYLLIISFVITLLIFIFREQLIGILLPGFNDERYQKAVEIGIIIFPIIFFKVFIGFFQSIYNAFQKFYAPVSYPVIISVFVFISIFLPYYKNDLMYNLSYANLMGNGVIALLFFYGIYKIGIVPDVKYFKLNELTKRILKNCVSIFILVMFNQIFIVSKNFFASYFGTGAISSLNYAGYLPVNISSFIFAVVFSVLLTKLSSSFATEKKSETKKLFFNTLLGLLFVLIPVSVYFILFKYDLLKLIFLRGNFDLDGINKIVIPFFWESLSMITFILFIVPTSLYLAKKKYFLMTKIGSIIYILGIFLNFILVRFIDFYGVAISQFVVGLLYGFFLLFFARKFLGRFGFYFWHLILLFVSGLITLTICYFCKGYVESFFYSNSLAGSIINLGVNFLLLTIIYLSVSKVLKVNYLEKIIRIYFSKV